MINKGDIVRMIKTEDWLAPMSVGNEYVVHDIKYGVATIYSGNEEKYYYLGIGILEEYFEKVVIELDDEDFDYIEDMINRSNITISKVFDKCTIVACQLPNGFVIVESASSVDADNYDEALNVEVCLNRIALRIVEMETYMNHEEEYLCNIFDKDNEDDEGICCEDCCEGKNCEYYNTCELSM